MYSKLLTLATVALLMASCGGSTTTEKGTPLAKVANEKAYCDLIIGSVKGDYSDFVWKNLASTEGLSPEKMKTLVNQYSQGIASEEWKEWDFEVREGGKIIGHGYRWAVKDTDKTRFLIEIKVKKTDTAYLIERIKFLSASKKIESYAFPGGEISPK